MLRPTSMRQVWVRMHQTGARYSVVAYSSAAVGVPSVGALAHHPVPAWRRINALRVVTLPRNPGHMFKVRQCHVEPYSEVGWCWLKCESFAVDEYINVTFCFPVVQMEGCRHCFGLSQFESPLFQPSCHSGHVLAESLVSVHPLSVAFEQRKFVGISLLLFLVSKRCIF